MTLMNFIEKISAFMRIFFLLQISLKYIKTWCPTSPPHHKWLLGGVNWIIMCRSYMVKVVLLINNILFYWTFSYDRYSFILLAKGIFIQTLITIITVIKITPIIKMVTNIVIRKLVHCMIF